MESRQPYLPPQDSYYPSSVPLLAKSNMALAGQVEMRFGVPAPASRHRI